MTEKKINTYALQKYLAEDLARKLTKNIAAKVIKAESLEGKTSYITGNLNCTKEKLVDLKINEDIINAKIYDPTIENLVEKYLDEKIIEYPKEIKTACLELMYIPDKK